MAASDDSGLLRKDLAVENAPVALDLKLPKGFKLSGKITLPGGDEPVSGGLNPTVIMAFSKDGEMVSGAVPDEGSYLMKPCLAQGEYTVLAARKDCAIEPAVLKIEKDTELNLSLIACGNLEINLKSDKLPVKDRKLVLKDQNGKELMQVPEGAVEFLDFLVGESSPVSDESGKISISGLKPGKYTMSIKDCKLSPDSVEIKSLEKTQIEATIE
jgi:hypothetical protein